jgi:hypothetical protein
MAIVLANKLVFLEHPRTGSTAVRKAIRKIGGHTKARHTYIAPVGAEKTVSTVRNPFDLLVSWWLIIKERLPGQWDSFARFLAEYDNPNMVRDGRLFYFETTFVMRYETLQADLNRILKAVGLRLVSLDRVNITPDKKPFMDYHDAETINIITNRFGRDMEEFYDKV